MSGGDSASGVGGDIVVTSGGGEAGDDLPEPRLSPVGDWLPSERLGEEHKAVGFYLSGHPLDDYLPALKRKGVLTLEEVAKKAERAGLCRSTIRNQISTTIGRI